MVSGVGLPPGPEWGQSGAGVRALKETPEHSGM